jgi:hypothetical protein
MQVGKARLHFTVVPPWWAATLPLPLAETLGVVPLRIHGQRFMVACNLDLLKVSALIQTPGFGALTYGRVTPDVLEELKKLAYG